MPYQIKIAKLGNIWMLVVLSLLSLTLLSACQTSVEQKIQTQAAAINAQDNTQLVHLMDEIWHYRLSQNPIKATRSHNNNYNDKLRDLSPQALALHNTKLTAYVAQLTQLKSYNLSDEDLVNLDILLRQINNDIDKYRFKFHYIPLMAESGFHTRIAFLPRVMPFKTQQDYRNYLDRLKAIPRYFAQNIHWMKQGLNSGITQPQVVLKGFEHGINSFIVKDATTSLFYKPFNKAAPTDMSGPQYQQLKIQAQKIISQAVIPAYQDFHHFMLNRYIPSARKTIGVSDTTDGTDYYTNRVKYYTTTQMSPEQVHQKGVEEVARIRSEMDKIISSLDFKGSFADFLQFLRVDKQFYATSAEQLIKEATFIAKKMDAKLPGLFNYLPRTPYGVEAVPAHLAPKYTTGRYISPSQDDQPGYYWVNTYALERRPLYVLEALTLHEAVPGHHLQNALKRELTNLPPHRRFSNISAFGEGWGLYSEFLGLEAGFYQDPYSNFGRLTYEMWRACRLVVDTGMHVKGWSREKAIDFLQSNTALSVHNVITEIDRYISWPGQALSYKIGELTIKRLRRETQATLGAQFDLREFHHQILRQGPLPLNVLEKQINNYVERVLAK
jgi:uncharacterized protein (DUF885 family)